MDLTKDPATSFFSRLNNNYSFELSPNYCNSCKNLIITSDLPDEPNGIKPSCKAKNLDFPRYLYANSEGKIFRPSECPLLGKRF